MKVRRVYSVPQIEHPRLIVAMNETGIWPDDVLWAFRRIGARGMGRHPSDIKVRERIIVNLRQPHRGVILSMPEIGEMLGNLSHSTVLTILRRAGVDTSVVRTE